MAAVADMLIVDEAQDYAVESGRWIVLPSYEHYYKDKIVGPVPGYDGNPNWTVAESPDLPPPPYPSFEPLRKGCAGWKAPAPFHHLQPHRPRMRYSRRRRHV